LEIASCGIVSAGKPREERQPASSDAREEIMKRFFRREVLASTAAVLGIPAAPIRAQSAFPRGPIRMFVGFSAGGTADIAARLLADKLRERTGVTIIIENRPGAGGVIATEQVIKMPADGKAIVLAAMSSTVLAMLTYAKLPYDPLTDLAPISLVSTFPLVLAISPSLPVDNVAKFVAWAKANPASTSYGVPALGAHSHFFGLMLGKAIGVDMQVVPYKGSAPMIADLSAGQIKVGVTGLFDFYSSYKAGKVRLLATSGRERSLSAPELPTFVESGYPDLVGEGWMGLYAPPQTPLPITSALSAEISAILALPDVRDRIITTGMEPRATTPAGLAEFDNLEFKKWQPVVVASGFKVE
jgi:tripartite-type tricarboxylate transporter receptor subunit TctC